MEIKAKVHVDHRLSPAGHPVTVFQFEGDIASTSKDAVLGVYQRLPRESSKLILLDFSKVGYINSSGITLVIQLLREAYQSARKIYAFGLSPHSAKVFTVAGITSYAGLFQSEADALTAL